MNRTILSLFFILLGLTNVQAQQKQTFSIASFELDQFDMTAKNEQYKKIDGNGSLYAIIKVTSTSPDDDLKAYHFSFGNMNSIVEQHDGELWVYVQRNAKMVTISRQGYATINKHDLHTTIESGKTYAMQLSVAPVKIQMQMVLFTIEPSDCKAMVTVKSSAIDAVEDVIGITDETGSTAKNMPYGTYTYKIASEGYYTTEGSFVLNDKIKTHHEKVTLRPRFAETTLKVDADADIYVDGEQMGKRTWRGRLNAGHHVVECRQLYHRNSAQTIVVEEGKANTYELTAPSPITGTLSIMSQPLGASITIDGKEYGETPKNIDGLLIGQHIIRLSKNGYGEQEISTVISENDVTEVNLKLQKGQSTVIVEEVPEKENRTINGVNEKEYLYKKHKRNANLYNWIAGIGGAGLIGAGLILLSVDGTSSATGKADAAIHRGSYTLMGGGVLWAGTFFLIANGEIRKANRLHNTSLWHHDINFKKGSTLTAGIDVLKDNVTRKQTLGLGFQYTF